MIIKKPYAFIVKYFKYIHAVFFLFLLYIIYKYFTIYKFFNDYVKTSYYTYYENLSGHFINTYLFLSILVIVITSAVLYLFMKSKEKNTKYYISVSVFYLVLFVLSTFLFSVYRTIEIENIDMRNIRIIRDILIMATLPQIFFTVFAFLRAIGFDLKSFDFKKDLDELDLTDEDNDVIEVLVPNDSYKYVRKFRRILRETKYFALEFKFFFLLIVSVIIVSIFLILYLNINVYNKKYKQNDKFISNSIKYTVKDSFITSKDYRGQTITKGKSYIILVLDITNIGTKKEKLDTEKLKLVVGNEEIFPTLSKGNYFVDVGKPYANQTLNPDTTYEYLIIYEINNKNIESKYTFRIFTEVDVASGAINSRHKNVIIYPENIENIEGEEKFKLNKEISLGESNLKKSSFTLKTFEIASSFEEKYNYCVEGNCFEGIKSFSPNIISAKPKVMIKLECNFDIDKDLYIQKEIQSASSFVKYFGSVYYETKEEKKTVLINVITSDYINKNKVFIEVPYEILNSENIDLILTVRDIRYIISLK